MFVRHQRERKARSSLELQSTSPSPSPPRQTPGTPDLGPGGPGTQARCVSPRRNQAEGSGGPSRGPWHPPWGSSARRKETGLFMRVSAWWHLVNQN